MSKGNGIPLEKGIELARAYLKQFYPAKRKVEIVGSIRRKESVIHDIDLLVYDEELHGQVSVGEIEGVNVQVWFCNAKCWGAMLLHTTGPAKFNIVCRVVAKGKGFRLNQYGVFNRESGKRVQGLSTEEDIIIKYIGRTYRKPELRS